MTDRNAILCTIHTFGPHPCTRTLIGPDAAGDFAAYFADGIHSGEYVARRGEKLSERAARSWFCQLLETRSYRR